MTAPATFRARAIVPALLGAAALAAPPAVAAERVSAFPQPGTISASPATQLTFRGVTGATLGAVDVRGSRSGRHTGAVKAHSDGKGVSWVPEKAFLRGETVTVRTRRPIHNARDGDYRFRVARIPDRVSISAAILENIPPGKLQRFKSRPDLAPPALIVDHDLDQHAPGSLFLSPKSKKDLKQAGPMIADEDGELVYFRPLPGIRAATDFRAQTYKGRPVLTYWDGTSRQGIGVGDLVVLDQSYRQIARIRTPNGFRPDLHEFIITPDDTALFISYPSVRADLRRVGGLQNGVAVDSVIQEVDIETGLVVFEWHSLGNIGLAESFSRPVPSSSVPFDYAHANAVTLDSDGDLLMSARNTWAVYKIDRRTGAIEWRLGGKRSDFKLGPGVRFAWQHDAQRRADGAITLFDNSAFPPVRKRSRALAIALDEKAGTARLLSARIHPRRLLAATQGNVQNLPNGNILVGWGSQRAATEYTPDGEVVWDGRVAVGFESYRAYRQPWVGLPKTRPRVAGVRAGSAMDVYASWNGATEVAGWDVLAGDSPDDLAVVAAVRRTGFETRARVGRRAAYVAVRAKDASGKALSTSPAKRVR